MADQPPPIINVSYVYPPPPKNKNEFFEFVRNFCLILLILALTAFFRSCAG